MVRPAKVYRGSNRRVNSIRLRGNMSREVWILVAFLLVLLFIAIPWLIRHPSAATRTITGQPVDESCYTMDNSNIDPRWWAGEPFLGNRYASRKAYRFHVLAGLGSPRPRQPTYWRQFDTTMPNTERVGQVCWTGWRCRRISPRPL